MPENFLGCFYAVSEKFLLLVFSETFFYTHKLGVSRKMFGPVAQTQKISDMIDREPVVAFIQKSENSDQ